MKSKQIIYFNYLESNALRIKINSLNATIQILKKGRINDSFCILREIEHIRLIEKKIGGIGYDQDTFIFYTETKQNKQYIMKVRIIEDRIAKATFNIIEKGTTSIDYPALSGGEYFCG